MSHHVLKRIHNDDRTNTTFVQSIIRIAIFLEYRYIVSLYIFSQTHTRLTIQSYHITNIEYNNISMVEYTCTKISVFLICI